jgi:hypothetical protein
MKLFVNRRPAKTIGITIPQSLVLNVDNMIE